MSTHENRPPDETPEWTVTPAHDETAYLMRSPANARRLRDAIARLDTPAISPNITLGSE